MIFSDGSTGPGSYIFNLLLKLDTMEVVFDSASVYVRYYTNGGDGAWTSFTTVDMNGSSDYLEVFGYNVALVKQIHLLVQANY